MCKKWFMEYAGLACLRQRMTRSQRNQQIWTSEGVSAATFGAVLDGQPWPARCCLLQFSGLTLESSATRIISWSNAATDWWRLRNWRCRRYAAMSPRLRGWATIVFVLTSISKIAPERTDLYTSCLRQYMHLFRLAWNGVNCPRRPLERRPHPC